MIKCLRPKCTSVITDEPPYDAMISAYHPKWTATRHGYICPACTDEAAIYSQPLSV